MASNKDLIEKIKEISPDAETDGLKNKELEAMLKLLKGDDVPPPPVKSKGLKVGKGKAITTLRGVLGEGEDISARDLNGGEGTLKVLQDKGYII